MGSPEDVQAWHALGTEFSSLGRERTTKAGEDVELALLQAQQPQHTRKEAQGLDIAGPCTISRPEEKGE